MNMTGGELDDTKAALTLCEIIGYELMVDVCEALGGANVYIPKSPPKAQRDKRIREEFQNLVCLRANTDGYMNIYKALSGKYDLEIRQIRRIISEKNLE